MGRKRGIQTMIVANSQSNHNIETYRYQDKGYKYKTRNDE